MLITWDSRNGRRLEKTVGLCKDYGLTALSGKVYIGNVKKNDLPELQQKLRRLLIGKKDRLFLFMLCKSCMENSTVPLAIQERIVQPPKFELVG
jgi:CRISPR/Cas system-associated endoribonuclease Cas2